MACIGVHRVFLKVLVLLLLTLSVQRLYVNNVFAVEEEYSPQSLRLTVYADGMVDVEYVVLVNPLLTSVNVTLPGTFYEDLLVTNEKGLPLDSSILNGKVLVYTLGSWKIKFFYTTADLTSKVGRVWTLHVNSPVAFTVKLPVDATIISLSEAPTSIWTTNGHYFITMPAGGQEISYVIGVIGSKERAATLIDEAEQTIKKMESEGVDTSQAQSKLDEAKTALEEGRYAEAEVLAKEARELAEKESVKEVVERRPNHLWVFIGLASIGLVAVLLAFFGFRRRGKHKVERRTREIKVQEILEKRRHLRLEDREAIEFIASAGGEVFEAELREHFKLPKSTVWRMVKRLKREGLVEVEKVGGQNLIRLVDKID